MLWHTQLVFLLNQIVGFSTSKRILCNEHCYSEQYKYPTLPSCNGMQMLCLHLWQTEPSLRLILIVRLDNKIFKITMFKIFKLGKLNIVVQQNSTVMKESDPDNDSLSWHNKTRLSQYKQTTQSKTGANLKQETANLLFQQWFNSHLNLKNSYKNFKLCGIPS